MRNRRWANPRQITRAVLMIEMDDGMQMGYEITHLREATVSMEHETVQTLDGRFHTVEQWGRVEVEGQFRGLIRQPNMDDYTDKPAIGPATPEIEP